MLLIFYTQVLFALDKQLISDKIIVLLIFGTPIFYL
jgi:hypothetical protein